jgi:hypothetical protein
MGGQCVMGGLPLFAAALFVTHGLPALTAPAVLWDDRPTDSNIGLAR